MKQKVIFLPLAAALLFSGCAALSEVPVLSSLPWFQKEKAPSEIAVELISVAKIVPALEIPDGADPEHPAAVVGEEALVSGTDPVTGKAREINDKSRPVAVMIQNNPESYPQWGLASADAVVEGLTEGTIPGLMAVYSSADSMPEKIGAVGPGRDLFWQFALPMNSVLMQIGSNIYADNLLNYYSYQNLDGTYCGTTCFDLDYEKEITENHEYCWFTNSNLMQNGLGMYNLSSEGESYSLVNYGSQSSGSSPAREDGSTLPAAELRLKFSDDAVTNLLYNDKTGKWEKYMNGTAQVDGAQDNEILSFDNVLVLYASAGVKDDGYTRDYDLTEGKALYLNNGSCSLVRWQKSDVTRGVRIFDSDGALLDISPGTTYIGIYGGFDGQSVRVRDANEQDQKIWDDPEPMEQAESLLDPIAAAAQRAAEAADPDEDDDAGSEV